MPHKRQKTERKKFGNIIIAGIVICAGVAAFLHFRAGDTVEEKNTQPEAPAVVKKLPEPPKKVVDYNQLEDDSQLSDLMDERKAKYGLQSGVDMVVKSDESIKIGEQTINMGDILDETRLQRGEIVEKDLGGTAEHGRPDKVEDFGIHVVMPGDNIWNIHFQLLKDYFEHRNIHLSPMADEPKSGGRSSGVGKILKFSEKMVYIYNVKEKKLAKDIHLLQPLGKIVVYRMGEIFALLDRLDYKNVSRIQFDGETLWVPAEQS